jgi:hypothetical protein
MTAERVSPDSFWYDKTKVGITVYCELDNSLMGPVTSFILSLQTCINNHYNEKNIFSFKQVEVVTGCNARPRLVTVEIDDQRRVMAPFCFRPHTKSLLSRIEAIVD